MRQFRFVGYSVAGTQCHTHRHVGGQTERQTDGRTDEYACPRQTQVIASLQTEVTDVKLRCQCEAI